jgi:hypothetical protein
MNPSQIVIVVCLALAPALLGGFVGIVLGRLYELKNNFVCGLPRWFSRFGLECWEVEQRQHKILVFWSGVGCVVGGFLAGSYWQYNTCWWSVWMIQL